MKEIELFWHIVNHKQVRPPYLNPDNKKKVAAEAIKIIKKFDFSKDQECFYFIDFND